MPIVKLRPAYSVKLVFSYVVKGIKIKITAKFLASRRLRVEDTKKMMLPEIRPKCFGTFEKRAPGALFSKVPKLFGRISDDIILFVSSKRRRLEARNLAVILNSIPLQRIKRPALQNKRVAVLEMAFRARNVFGTLRNWPQMTCKHGRTVSGHNYVFFLTDCCLLLLFSQSSLVVFASITFTFSGALSPGIKLDRHATSRRRHGFFCIST